VTGQEPRDSKIPSEVKKTHFFFGNSLSREVVESPCLEILKNQLDMSLVKLLYLTLLEQEDWTRLAQEIPFNKEYCVIL